MATLRAMFKLFDGYSTTINKIVTGTNKAEESVRKASRGTDVYNQSLSNTGVAASRANSGLTKLIGTVLSLAAAKKGMDLTDTYTNTSARLSMITGSLEEQKALQAAVFAAADRSRGSYVEMANATAKMKMLAGDAFGSNEEALGFTELLQKSLKVSGASQGEQDSAFLQLTQAMAAGKLQGDEFRSIMENAPMVANAISQYLGVTKGELKELSSDGAITADIIKNAMFNAADDINGKFAQMPMTFADVWTKIKNTGMQAFGDVFEKANAMLNSDMGQAAIMNLTGLVYMAAAGFDALLDGIGWVGDHLDILAPIVLGLAGAWLVYNATAGIAWLTTLKNVTAMALKATADWAEYAAIFMLIWAQEGFNAALAACPITWIIGAVILLIAAFYAGVAAINHFAGTSVSATGLIGGAFGFLAANLFNIFVFPIWNGLAMLGNFLGNVFTKPKVAVQMLFLNMAKTCIDYVINMAKVIENVINRIPGVTKDITSGLEEFKINIESKMESIKDESGWKEYIKQPELMDVSTMTAKGYKKGAELGNKASNFLSGFVPDLGGNDKGWDQFATGGNPAVVKGTGKGGAMKVEKDDKEDIEWMRKLAERDYVAELHRTPLPRISRWSSADQSRRKRIRTVS
ncbi:MAG: tape measure protein [Enterocloster bolteae]